MANGKPQILKGFRDLLPAEMLARDKIISVIKKVYESYGFVPLATPSLEYADLLIGSGEETDKQIYTFDDRDGSRVGLIYELTASLKRVMTEHKELPRPFKRYQVQPVWRYDKPDPGRFREFIQFDIDTIGTSSMLADAEIIAAMHDCLKELGLDFRIRFSSRKVLNALIEFAGIDHSMAKAVFRVLDKLDKQGLEAVRLELGPGRTDQSGDRIEGLGLDDENISRIEDFLNLPQSTRAEAVASLRSLFAGVKSAAKAVDELEELHRYLDMMGIPDDMAPIDLSIARGLDYYTGPVYEAILIDRKAGRVGSIMGGGRYDESIFADDGELVPATGASIGVDRLFAAVQRIGKVDMRPSTADILVTTMDKVRMGEYIRLAGELRSAGYNTELYLGGSRAIKKQLKYADRQEIPIAVLAGSNEFEAGEVSIKDLRKIRQEEVDIKDRKTWVEEKVGQVTVPRKKMLAAIKSMLGY